MKNKLTKGSNLVWEASRMILPEHKELIRKHYEELNDVIKPILSEDKLEELERTVIEAIEFKSVVEITYYKNKRVLKYQGIIIRQLDLRRLEVEVADGLEFLKIDNIIDIEWI
ncbi:YolD-like family protein [Amphibacillus cookii]|uniref:YolD-like family protein n=1 Tax=Amphibacillus cookii TaxID=767787 RepID=UPI00195E4547|nr:YolD-like family protein [Amphibacillus cookii]MBM7540655.1 vacuolar-type H+-ATPase subunit E/Vma4 [Amphibacillus cookii]